MTKRLEHRTERILIAAAQGSVSVEELITNFAQRHPRRSIRLDCARLESKGFVKRTHGGARWCRNFYMKPFPLSTRRFKRGYSSRGGKGVTSALRRAEFDSE